MYVGKNSYSKMKYHYILYNTKSIRLTIDQIKILQNERFSKNCLNLAGLFSNNISAVSGTRSIIDCKFACYVCIKLTHVCLLLEEGYKK